MPDDTKKINVSAEVIAKITSAICRHGLNGGLAVLEYETGEYYSERQLLLMLIESYPPEEAAAIISHAFTRPRSHPPD